MKDKELPIQLINLLSEIEDQNLPLIYEDMKGNKFRLDGIEENTLYFEPIE